MARQRASALVRWVALIVVLGGLLWGGSAAYLALTRPVVMVSRVVKAPAVSAFYATGTLLPSHEYSMRSNAAGILTSVLVDKGDAVRKGQVLAVVADDQLKYRLEQAKAELAEKEALADEKTSPVFRELDARIAGARELLEIARRELKRVNDMAERNAATPADIDRAMDRVKQLSTEYEAAVALRAARKLNLQRERDVARAALEMAQWNLDQLSIRSPIDGVVLDRPLTVGTRVGVRDHVMWVADVSPRNLLMRASVDEEDRTQVRLDQTVYMSLYAFPNRLLMGRVQRIYPKADPDRRTFDVDVVPVEVEENLAAGMTGELNFIVAQKDGATVVPTQAVQNGAVWVVREGRLHRSQVEVGLRSIERTEILRGVEVDELVVISPAEFLKEGQRVRTTVVDSQVAAAMNRPREDTGRFRGFR